MKSLKPFALISLTLILVVGCNRKKASSETESSEPKRSQAKAVESLPEQAPEPPPAAPSETPAGPASVATIGYQGGSLRSSDGRVEISLPPGALYADTQVSIQPINNDDLDGIGPGYRLSPEGTQFNTAVMLTWHLSEADLSGHAITEATIATRDENGTWTRQHGVQYDAAAKVVRVATNHFSGWKATWAANLPIVTITPPQDEISIDKNVDLHVTYSKAPPLKSPDPKSNNSTSPPAQKRDGEPATTSGGVDDGDLLTAPTPKGASDDDLTAPAPVPCQWRVNGMVNGNPTYGYVRPAQGENKATYTAPSKIPARNPVAVSCEMKTGHAKIVVVSNIMITDKQGWAVDARYEYAEEHSLTGSTGFGTTGTTWGNATRVAYAHFHVYSDSRYGAGAVGGMGRGDVTIVEKAGTNLCHGALDETHISGPIAAEGNGAASRTGQLTVILHGDNLHGLQHHDDHCGKGITKSDEDWDTASFGIGCNFTGVDYEKGGTFSADVPSDQGHGKCTLTIEPD